MKFRRLLLTSIILSFVILGIRLVDLRSDVEALTISKAHAQDETKDKDIEAAKAKLEKDAGKNPSVKVDEEAPKPEASAEKPTEEKKAEEVKSEDKKDDAAHAPADGHEAAVADPHAEKPAGDAAAKDQNPSNPLFYSDAEIEVLQQLSTRRQELDERERSLIQKESLLKVTEERLDQKINELNEIKKNLTDIQTNVMKSVGEVDKQQEEEMKKLVKTYESMKPKDAARIFDETDIDIVFSIVSRMKEAKLAPVLAGMDAKKAKTLTAMLAEKKKVPNPEVDAVKGLDGTTMPPTTAPAAAPVVTPPPATPSAPAAH